MHESMRGMGKDGIIEGTGSSLAERMRRGPRAQLEQMSKAESAAPAPANAVHPALDAIRVHRERWQRINGTDPRRARPADIELWAVLDAIAHDETQLPTEDR